MRGEGGKDSERRKMMRGEGRKESERREMMGEKVGRRVRGGR